MNKNIVLDLMREYGHRRRNLVAMNEDISRLIEIKYDDNEDEFFMDASDELMIYLIWSLDTNIDINFITACVNYGLFYLNINKDILTKEQLEYLESLEVDKKYEDMEKFLDFILEEGKKTYEVN